MLKPKPFLDGFALLGTHAAAARGETEEAELHALDECVSASPRVARVKGSRITYVAVAARVAVEVAVLDLVVCAGEEDTRGVLAETVGAAGGAAAGIPLVGHCDGVVRYRTRRNGFLSKGRRK